MDKIFKALADKNRRKILSLLKEKNRTVNELLENFDITQATLSNHLAILRKSELVYCEVKGKNRVYSLNKELLKAFSRAMNKFTGNEEQILGNEMKLRGR